VRRFKWVGLRFCAWSSRYGRYYTFFGRKLARLAILGLIIALAVFVIFYDHMSDFLQPDFRFGILLSFIATISWALEVYTKKKAATFNPYFSLGLQMLLSSFILLLQV
jgi:drug/metabolite transporter (DMT)-like permease